MSGNVDTKLLGAFIALRERAAKGDTKAKEDLAKIVSSPQSVMKIRAAAARVQQAQQLALAALSAPSTTDVVGEEEIYTGDEIDAAEQAHRMLPPGSDSLDHKALLRKNKWSSLNEAAPFARTNPVSVLAGTLGGQQLVLPGQKFQVANWGGDDAETMPITVTLAPVEQVNQIGVGLSSLLRPYGVVQFGTRGFAVKFEVDIGRGCEFTVSGSMCTVEVALPDTSSGQNSSMKLAGMLSFRQVENIQPITRTVYDLVANPVAAVDIVIPAFAKTVTFYNSNVAAPLTFSFLENTGPVVFQYVMPAGTTFSPAITLPGDVFGIQIAITGGGAFANVRAVFGLSV